MQEKSNSNRVPTKRAVRQKTKEHILDEEPHPCFVEALQNISKVEHQMNTLHERDSPDRAFVVSDIGKEVKPIERRSAEHRRSESHVRSQPKGRSQADCR